MANLPLKIPWAQADTKWASQINPIIANPLLDGRLVSNQPLINGVTAINHGLARPLKGWFLVGINANATIHDNQATNQHPELTLSLTSNAVCTVNLWVF